MGLKNKLYNILVERNPEIRSAYQGYVNENPERHRTHRLVSWMYLLTLNFQYYLCKRTSLESKSCDNSVNNLNYPESEVSARIPIDILVEQLSAYDVISFDIFDTLIFRAVSDPKDLFIVVGNRLSIPKFRESRIEAEALARKKTGKPYGEVTINDIYEILEVKCGINKNLGIKTEFQAEKELCFANPYMKEVVEKLTSKGKQIIAVSNMYLPKEMISELLTECGYNNIEEIFVSCDYLCSKHKGLLQSNVWSIIGKNKTVVHIGDNYYADFIGSRMAGWKSFFYKNVNELGKSYRPANMSKLGGSIYKGLVNAKIHNGIKKLDPYYELGYVYGGILACNYCKWINKFAAENKIDKLFFSGRDMYIVHEIYNKYYKEFDNDYIYISRFASQRFSYDKISEYFIDIHIRSRAKHRNLTLKQVFQELELNFLERFLESYGLEADEIFTLELFDHVKEFLNDYKAEILKEFESERNAAIRYYSQFISNTKRIAVVDLGWQGTNSLCLKNLLEENFDVQVYSLLMCAVGQNFLDYSISAGVTHAFCCSPQKNTNLLNQFRHPKYGRFIAELIFTSTEQTLKRFTVDHSGKVLPIFFTNEQRNESQILKILEGIRDFADDFNRLHIVKNEISYSGFESLIPLNKLSYNTQYMKKILTENEVNPWIGATINKDASNDAKL